MASDELMEKLAILTDEHVEEMTGYVLSMNRTDYLRFCVQLRKLAILDENLGMFAMIGMQTVVKAIQRKRGASDGDAR